MVGGVVARLVKIESVANRLRVRVSAGYSWYARYLHLCAAVSKH